MLKTIETVKEVFRGQSLYFSEYGKEIALRNLELMRTISWVSIFIYGMYFLITTLFFKEWEISLLYALFVPVMYLFFLITKRYLNAEEKNIHNIRILTLLMYSTLMVETIVLSVFPHPNVAGIYYPLFLLMGPVFFILPIRNHLLMTFSSIVIFCTLVLSFKAPVVWSHEIFEAVTASLFSIIVMILMTQFRLQSDRLKGKYYKLSREDNLTGMLNKSSGISAIEAYFKKMRLQEQFAILFLDIDNFKNINDTYGHIQGDRILKKIGFNIRSTCRVYDIICRFGGDEFLVLLKDIANADVAAIKAQQILDTIMKDSSDAGLVVTASIGIYCGDDRTLPLDSILKKADAALYQGKQKGKNCFEIYQEESEKD